MKFIQQEIPGVWLIAPEEHVDHRGVLRRHYCEHEFKKAGLESRVAQTNVSENFKKHTLRGFHYQIHPFEESKTISSLTGAFYDIVVDLRPQSPTYLQWRSFEISCHNKLALHVPGGCANAYLTLEDHTLIHYYMSEFYHSESYRGFRYNDPKFNFKWPATPAVISDKDLNYSDFVTGSSYPV